MIYFVTSAIRGVWDILKLLFLLCLKKFLKKSYVINPIETLDTFCVFCSMFCSCAGGAGLSPNKGKRLCSTANSTGSCVHSVQGAVQCSAMAQVAQVLFCD